MEAWSDLSRRGLNFLPQRRTPPTHPSTYRPFMALNQTCSGLFHGRKRGQQGRRLVSLFLQDVFRPKVLVLFPFWRGGGAKVKHRGYRLRKLKTHTRKGNALPSVFPGKTKRWVFFGNARRTAGSLIASPDLSQVQSKKRGGGGRGGEK